MKKFYLIIVMSMMAQVGFAKASIFQYDRQRVENQLLKVNLIDHFLDQNEKHLTLTELNNMFSVPTPSDNVLGLSGFWWGFGLSIIGAGVGCFTQSFAGFVGFSVGFGLVGVLLTYLLTEDKKQTVNALIGCASGSVLSVAVVFLLALSIVAAGS